MRKWALAAGLLLALSAAVSPAAAKDPTTLTLPKGARIGVINLMDAEVTHFHTAKVLAQSFLKTLQVGWPVDSMFVDAVTPRLAQLGMTGVALAPSDALARGRDEFFVNNSVAKGLPRECAKDFATLAASAHVDALIVLAPGLNNSSQAGAAVRRTLPDYLRGWGFVTSDTGAKPGLFNMTQVLLIAVDSGSATLQAREWGGAYTDEWLDFSPPPDLKQIPAAELDKLQPVFGRMLARQAGRTLDWLAAKP